MARSRKAAGQRLDGDSDNFVAAAMTTRPYGDHEARDSHLIAHTLRADGFDASEDGTGRGTPLVPVIAPTLFASNGGVSSGYHPVIPIDMRQASRGETMTNNRPEGSSGGALGTGIGDPGDPAPSISLSHPPAVGFIVNAAESCARQSHARRSEIARCLDSTGSFASAQGGTVIKQSMAVRRLTPRECERLQGFPDNFTLIPVKPVPARGQVKARTLYQSGDERFAEIDGVMHFVSADGPRYKALGNSFAVPVVAWLGRRIQMVEELMR